ncbi:H-NS histone family protein [Burkholderia sp. Ac-20353]|uniref:H-NS family nucleoid-associated regulatory protein n=1 Tax=Burkholderia sp. Ac-20353 TaxID=2703894 RepID=UPI00197B690E|nr:H-NS histone family protein [Burkholderia sp. Ac-20353]
MSTTLQDLQAQLRETEQLLADAKKAEKQAVLTEFKKQVEFYDISQQEVLIALGYVTPRKRQAPAKYYDPSSGRSWSGHGRRPKWLEGKVLDAYLVDRTPQLFWPETSD